METNRFLEMDEVLKQKCGKKRRRYAGLGRGFASPQSVNWARATSAQTRALVILIENGGVDLGIPTLVDKLLAVIPGASMISDETRQQLVDLIREKIKKFTDNLL